MVVMAAHNLIEFHEFLSLEHLFSLIMNEIKTSTVAIVFVGAFVPKCMVLLLI